MIFTYQVCQNIDAITATVAEQAAPQLPGALGTPAAMALPPLTATESDSGEMLATVNANTDSVIKTSSSTRGSAAFKEVALAEPKGSLSGSGTLSLSEGSSLASPILAEALGIAEVSQASPTVIVSASAVSIINPLTIALPLSSGIGLGDGLLQVIAIVPDKDNAQTLQVLASDKVKVSGKLIYAEITQFGAYQAVKMSSQPAKTSVPTDLVPVKQPGGGGTTAEIGAALLLASPDGLPTCTPARQGALYYILSLKQFQACNDGGWVVVNLTGPTGPKGDTGAIGPVGPKAPDPVPYFSTQSSTYKFENGRFINTTTDNQYANYGGQLLRVCKSDSWTEQITNGQAYKTRNYGDAGCLQSTVSVVGCSYGYVNLDGQCVAPCASGSLAQCTSQALCEASQMVWDTGTNSCKGSCSSSNLSACVSDAVCKSNNLIWLTNRCEVPCANNNLAACTTEERCTGSGMTWAGGKCLGSCSVDQPSACTAELSCTQKGMIWSSSENKCLGVCGFGNLTACNTRALCQSSYSDDGGTNIYPAPGFWNDTHCSNSCGLNKMPSRNGCIDVQFCFPDSMGRPRKWADNVCTDISYQVIEQSQDPTAPVTIGGTYNQAVQIKAGVYTVSSDVTFNNGVVIDGDTQLIAAGNYSLKFKKTVAINGTQDHGVTFGVADPSIKWSSIQFFNNHDHSKRIAINPFDIDGTHKTGTRVANLLIDGAADSQIAVAGYFTNLSINGIPASIVSTDYDSSINAKPGTSGLFLTNSTLRMPPSTQFSYSEPIILFKNTFLNTFSFYAQNGLLWANRWDVGAGSQYAPWGGAAIFNEFDEVSCSGQIFGNSSRQAVQVQQGCVQGEHSVNGSVSQKAYVFIHDGYFRPLGSNSSWTYLYKGYPSNKFYVTVLNATGTLPADSIHWSTSYVDDMGAVVPITEADGGSYSFTPPVRGPLTLSITSANNTLDLIGQLTRTLNVQ